MTYALRLEQLFTLCVRLFFSFNMASQHIVFSFAGQGFPPVEAARDLYRVSSTFRQAITDVQETINGLSHDGSIPGQAHVPLTDYFEEDEIRPPYAASFDRPLSATQHSLPPSATLVIVSAQYALGKLLQSWGVSPQSVMAYSLGEIAAGTFTGSYTLPAMVKLLARREGLLEDRSLFPNKGGLALVFTDGDSIKQVLAKEGLLGTVDIAGFSSPVATCVAGDAAQLDIVLKKLSDTDLSFKRVKLDIGMHSGHVQALADHVRSSPNIFPEKDSKDCKVLPGIDHWSSLGIQLPTGSPLNANHYATVLRRPLRYRDCVPKIFEKHMSEQPEQDLVFVDMGMGPGQLYKLIMAALEHTAEWQRGQVRAMASIDPVDAGDAKNTLGWAKAQLKDNLSKAHVLLQKSSTSPGMTGM
ncbi:FabD/lysophospholipase-like protein [Aureobasidium pullulans]|nr:FabD/lysophospholipase-like protein [Aureobasidium pullulans]